MWPAVAPARSPPSSTSTPGRGLDAGRPTPAHPHGQSATPEGGARVRPPPPPAPKGGGEPLFRGQGELRPAHERQAAGTLLAPPAAPAQPFDPPGAPPPQPVRRERLQVPVQRLHHLLVRHGHD